MRMTRSSSSQCWPTVSIAGVAFSCDPNGGGPYVRHQLRRENPVIPTLVLPPVRPGTLRTYYLSEVPRPRQCGGLALLRPIIELIEELRGDFSDPARPRYRICRRPPSATSSICCRSGRCCPSQGHPVASWRDRQGKRRKSPARSNCSAVHILTVYGKRSVFGVMPDWNPCQKSLACGRRH